MKMTATLGSNDRGSSSLDQEFLDAVFNGTGVSTEKTSTAPVVGQHIKNPFDLAVYDPLMLNDSFSHNSSVSRMNFDSATGVSQGLQSNSSKPLRSARPRFASADCALLPTGSFQVSEEQPGHPFSRVNQDGTTKQNHGHKLSSSMSNFNYDDLATDLLNLAPEQPINETSLPTETPAEKKSKRPPRGHRKGFSLGSTGGTFQNLFGGGPNKEKKKAKQLSPKQISPKQLSPKSCAKSNLQIDSTTCVLQSGDTIHVEDEIVMPTRTVKTNVLSPFRRKKTSISPPRCGAKSPISPIPSNNTSPTAAEAAPSLLSSPMMQELWDVQHTSSALGPDNLASPSNLVLPTFSKPRPTSFLTGKSSDIARTSENHPSDWQCTLPSRVDCVTTARLCYFLDVYRQGEPCGARFLSGLKGIGRHDLEQFAQGYTTAAQMLAAASTTDTGSLSFAIPAPPATSPTSLSSSSPTSSSAALVSDCHRSIIESLLDCGQDIVQVQGHVLSSGGDIHDQSSYREVLIVERQRQLLVVMRGTTSEQQGKFSKNSQQKMVPLPEHPNVRVYADRLNALDLLDSQTFELLDQLTEQCPFIDICFAGHGYGAALATLAAYRYAEARSDLRVGALVTASPRVTGMDTAMSLQHHQETTSPSSSSFRAAVHSQPNLKVIRVEVSNSAPTDSTPAEVGHVIRVPHSNKQQPPRAYRFGRVSGSSSSSAAAAQDNNTALHNKRGGLTAAIVVPKALQFVAHTSRGEKQVSDYIRAYEDIDDAIWVTSFYQAATAAAADGRGGNGEEVEERCVS